MTNKIPYDLDKYYNEDSILGDVAKGFAGDNRGIKLSREVLYDDSGFTYNHTIQKSVGDLTRGLLILLGAHSGIGKTSVVDDFFVWNSYIQQMLGANIDIIYESWEINKFFKRARLASYLVYEKYCYNIPIDKLLSRSDNIKLSEDEVNKIVSVKDEIDDFFIRNKFYTSPKTPTEFKNSVMSYAEANGKFIYNNGELEYIANDYKKISLFVIDHIGLVSPEKGQSKKQAIDEIASICREFRNSCGFTFIIVQQFNTSMKSVNKTMQNTEHSIAPQDIDFGDSTYTYRDADIVFGLVRPSDYLLMNYHNYNMGFWRKNILGLYLLKTRFGAGNNIIPLYCNYEAGKFIELPPAEDFKRNQSLHNQFKIDN